MPPPISEPCRSTPLVHMVYSRPVFENTYFMFFFRFQKSTTFYVFTALHGMQTRSSDENSVRPSVRLSVCHTRGL